MQKKFAILLIAIIGGAAVGGSIGFMTYNNNQMRNMQLFNLSALALVPVKVRIEVTCDVLWEGSWTIGEKGEAVTEGPGTYNYNGTIAGSQVVKTNFYHTSMAVPGLLAVNLYINGKLEKNATETVALAPVKLEEYSPIVETVIPIALYFVMSNPLELI
jgi:hypothetical protein